MKINSVITALIAVIFLVSGACQRALHFETDALSSGVLVKDNNGNCLPADLTGTLLAGKNITDSVYLELELDIKVKGPYSIHTDTINGYCFKTNGDFTSTGRLKIKLEGFGKPVIAGSDNFTVFYAADRCNININVRENLTEPAVFRLAGTPDTCMKAIIYGNYINQIALDTTNRIRVEIEVIKPGTYSITSNSVNGYKFSATGSLPEKGNHFVYLQAAGTPSTSGKNIFTIVVPGSSCFFSIDVYDPVRTNNTDYFPLSKDNFWVYDHSNYPGDSINRIVIDSTISASGLTYIMEEKIPFALTQQLFFRKTGVIYFESASADKFTNSFRYNNMPPVDILFLRNTLSTGDEWSSMEYSGTATFGQVLVIRYVFKCIDNNVTISVNGKVFTNVYRVNMLPYLKSEFNTYGSTGESFDFYYAKGIGLIYATEKLNGVLQYEQKIRRWLVN